MNTVERLRRDHKILRAKLDLLESALRIGAQTWFVLREVCFTLSRQLRDHIRREEELVAACRSAMNPKVLAEVVVVHREEPQLLQTVNRLFVTEAGQSWERLRPLLTGVIEGLRRHMDEEEAELFPILERMLAEQETVRSAPPKPRSPLDETMTVNRIVQRFPRTKPVFEQFFIHIPTEGCTCLDEVAWRHGMESRELLERLEQAIEACGCTKTAGRTAEDARETSPSCELVG